jgi:hypothetical protein
VAVLPPATAQNVAVSVMFASPIKANDDKRAQPVVAEDHCQGGAWGDDYDAALTNLEEAMRLARGPC